MSLFWNGRLRESQALFARVFATQPSVGPHLLMESMLDRSAMMLGYLSGIYWMTGQPDRAVREVQQAFDLAESKKDPYSIGIAGSMLCWLQFARRDPLDAIRTATPARSSHADSGSSHPSGARQDGVIALIARGNFASRACGSCATPRIVCIRWMAARLPRAVRFGGRGGDSFARIAAIWSALL